MDGHITLTDSSLEKLFPFYIRLDKDLRITKAGRSIKKVMGDIEGRLFVDCFRMLRPKLSIQMSFTSFCEHQNLVVITEALTTTLRLRFRGELIKLSESEELHYLSSPWLVDTTDLGYYDLSFSDFALHDTVTDNLQVLRSKELVNEDLIKIADELISQRNELVEKNAMIEEIARFPDQNPQPILRIDFQGDLLYSNAAAGKLMEKHDLLNLPFWSSVYNRFVENEFRGFDTEILLDEMILHLTLVPFPTKGYFNLYIRDVSEIVRYQQELLTINARLSTLLTTMQSGVLAENVERKIILMNRKFCDIFALNALPDEMLGYDAMKVEEEFKGNFVDQATFLERIDQLLNDRVSVFGEQLFMQDGRVLERDYIPIIEDNVYKGHIWKYQDITELVNSNESLKKVEEKYRKIIEALDFGLIEVDQDERITKVYPAFCRLTGYDEEDLLGANAREMLAFDGDLHRLDEQLDARNKGQAGIYEVRLRTKGGGVKWVIISGSPIFNERNQVVGSIGIHIDITERKILEQELTEARERALSSVNAKQLFLANISHELRTPINVLKGMADLLEGTKLDPEQLSYIQAMQTASKNLMGLINNVLDFSKIEAGHLTISKVDVNLAELLNNTHIAFIPVAREKGVELSYVLDEAIEPHLVGDPLKIGQVLSNLVSNALKFTENGHITVRAGIVANFIDKQVIRFEVEDTGIGIAKENQEKIFQTFIQEDQSISRRYGGTGLGLAICSGIVNSMKGSIGVESSPGSGSTFFFEIPLEKGVIVPSVQLENEILIKGLEDRKILVAEDNPLNQLLISSILAKSNIRAHMVVNGLEVLEQLEKES
ncbi:MAG: ATP-binding protein, partial [Bacteroidota bacterium]